MNAKVKRIEQALNDRLGGSVLEFLNSLGGPSCIYQPGKYRGPRRVVVTLLHGDEPSGIRALWHWLESAAVPYADTLFIVGNVEAALAAPGFAHRHLPGERDMNRCFREPWDDPQGRRCREILDAIEEFDPICLIDMHNTSGVGPAFGVTTSHSDQHEALITGFSEKLIVTDIRLGSLMEAGEKFCPTVTIECGGAIDAYADTVAAQGLKLFLESPNPLVCANRDMPVDLLHHPVRVELVTPFHIGYNDGPSPADVTLVSDVERFNFGVVKTTDRLGWLSTRGLAALTAVTSDGRDVIQQIFRPTAQGELRPAQALKLFMVTSKPEAAREDCLFYAVRADDKPW